MPAYDKSLLKENMGKMGLVFKLLYRHKYNYFDSVREFMSKSPIRAGMDKGAVSAIFRSYENIYASVDYSHLPVADNRKIADVFVEEWPGQVYCYFQWYYDIPSKEIVFKMPPEEVCKYFSWACSHEKEDFANYLYDKYFLKEE